jgi:hypothetical protein
MRNFSKTLISMAAVMAVGSAMAAGAMAANLSATYADGTVSIGGVTTGKSQYTLLVVQGVKAEGASDYTYKAESSTIKQIDQNDAGVPFTSATVGTLAEGSYKVLVGNNDGTVDSGIFVVGGGTVEPGEPDDPVVETKDVLVGDSDENKKVNGTDVTWIRRFNAGYTERVGKVNTSYTKADGTGAYIVGDADDNGKVNGTDVTWVRRFNAGYTERVGKVNTTITVNVE